MAENSSAEQTEDPTARKLSKAREDGQVARSPELPAAAVTIGAILAMFMMGGESESKTPTIAKDILFCPSYGNNEYIGHTNGCLDKDGIAIGNSEEDYLHCIKFVDCTPCPKNNHCN